MRADVSSKAVTGARKWGGPLFAVTRLHRQVEADHGEIALVLIDVMVRNQSDEKVASRIVQVRRIIATELLSWPPCWLAKAIIALQIAKASAPVASTSINRAIASGVSA